MLEYTVRDSIVKELTWEEDREALASNQSVHWPGGLWSFLKKKGALPASKAV